ncbi:hypothetical protein D1610_14945 [Sphingomonas gilva]|uniref:TonB C-terminal domain-containing protein n=1 Tax=Sphingomonas gilva TaxID=2305907 RepID=A0A396S010_9SPHN|nr:energy transducer TonB [Sphingomonas gilva]RHW16685.1 hypothetical protein D1610_14945 [Sphingomonas gilva]
MMTSMISLLLAAAQAATPSPAAPQSRQQLFDDATKAVNDGQCEEALKLFAALDARPASKPNPAVEAVIGVRKAICLARLDRGEESEALLAKAIPVLTPLGPQYHGDLRDAHLLRAKYEVAGLDYASALPHLEKALAVSTGFARYEPLSLLARVTMFDEGSQALAYADEGLALVRQHLPDNKKSIAAAHTTRARVLLNQGQHKQAYEELRKALSLQGGLDLKVGVADIITRSDLALAALLAGDEDAARKYLAYTGAGRTEESPFGSAVAMHTPMCGGDAGLKPEDRAVVEFGVTDDGAISHAGPIYATGGREAALEFARAVSQWSWRPEQVAKIPLLFRYLTRVELRCSTVGERPGLTDTLQSDFDQWLKSRGLAPLDLPDSPALALPVAQAAHDRLKGDPDNPQRIAPLMALLDNPLVADKDRQKYRQEAERLIMRASPPAGVRTLIGIRRIAADDVDDYRRHLRSLLADPVIQADAHGAATLRLLIAERHYRKPPPDDADALLQAVVGDSRLPADDPLRVAALLEQSSRAAAAGRIEDARAAFDETGLTEQQCELIGIQPAMRRTGASSSDFPMEAMRWGFEGWVRTEFDILADGRTTAQRAIIAYPPFVFEEAATGIIEDARFQSSYRPSGGAACSGRQQQIVFRMPG